MLVLYLCLEASIRVFQGNFCVANDYNVRYARRAAGASSGSSFLWACGREASATLCCTSAGTSISEGLASTAGAFNFVLFIIRTLECVDTLAQSVDDGRDARGVGLPR